jgi:hypothetical protein
MVGLIRERLGGFMRQHKLTEYLASIGTPEIQKFKEREADIVNQMQQLTPSNEDAADRKDVNAPDFQSRYKVKDLFAQFTEEFTGKARERGVELHWIGVGTWESPIKEISDEHFEAWMLSQENLKNDSPERMKKIEQEVVVERMKELIQKVPISAYDEITDSSFHGRRNKKHSLQRRNLFRRELTAGELEGKFMPTEDDLNQMALQLFQDRRESKVESRYDYGDSSHFDDMRVLLAEYLNQFVETKDLIESKNGKMPAKLNEAIKLIEAQVNAHWIGK